MNLKKLILSFYADKKPHYLYQQFFWIKNINRKISDREFLNIHRKLFFDNLIEYYKDNFDIPIVNRQFILTDKGDEAYRIFSIEKGANFEYYKYFKRK